LRPGGFISVQQAAGPHGLDEFILSRGQRRTGFVECLVKGAYPQFHP
jgi:hypothetical protein